MIRKWCPAVKGANASFSLVHRNTGISSREEWIGLASLLRLEHDVALQSDQLSRAWRICSWPRRGIQVMKILETMRNRKKWRCLAWRREATGTTGLICISYNECIHSTSIKQTFVEHLLCAQEGNQGQQERDHVAAFIKLRVCGGNPNKNFFQRGNIVWLRNHLSTVLWGEEAIYRIFLNWDITFF